MKRNTLILTALVVLLGAAAWLVTMKPGEQSASAEEGQPLVQIDSLAVDKIAIKSATGSVTLEKQGVGWFITAPLKYKADQNAVGQVLHQSKHLNVKSVVSTKPEKQSVFQVDSTGTLVAISQGRAERASFIVGKNSQSYSEQYVRLANSNDVTLVDGSFGYVFNKPLKDWRDKNIVTVPREQIKEVKYQYGDTTFALSFKDSVWMLGRDSVQSGVVESLLGSLASVQCDDFIDSTVANAKFSAQISYAGMQLRFVFNKATNKYFVQSSAAVQWFTMEQWRANQILKRKKEIAKR
jgi:hypothetical protein